MLRAVATVVPARAIHSEADPKSAIPKTAPIWRTKLSAANPEDALSGSITRRIAMVSPEKSSPAHKPEIVTLTNNMGKAA